MKSWGRGLRQFLKPDRSPWKILLTELGQPIYHQATSPRVISTTSVNRNRDSAIIRIMDEGTECLEHEAALGAYWCNVSAANSSTLTPTPAEKHARTIHLREGIKAVKPAVPCASTCECS